MFINIIFVLMYNDHKLLDLGVFTGGICILNREF
jgi:hypothetical protein